MDSLFLPSVSRLHLPSRRPMQSCHAPCHSSTAINPPCAATAHSNACLSLLSAAQFYAVPPDNLLTALSSFPTEALTRHITGRVLPRIVQLQQLVVFRRAHRLIDSHQLIQYRVRRWCENTLSKPVLLTVCTMTTKYGARTVHVVQNTKILRVFPLHPHS